MKIRSNPYFATALAITAIGASAICAAPLYWKTSAAAAWDSASWATAPGGTYDQAWVSGSDVIFEDNGGTALTINGPLATTQFASIMANENVTLAPSTTLGTGGTIAIIDVAAGKTLDFSTQAVSTAAGTGFIKNGEGTWSLAGGTYAGGFTLNAGTVAVGGVNAMGSGGTLTINGGAIRSNGTNSRDLSGKYTSITLGGDCTLGDATATGALTFSNSTSLGSATRTLTVNSAVTHTGVISGDTGAGLTKVGPGTLTLGGANIYTGPTSVSNGILTITATGALPGYNTSGKYSVASGAALAVYNAVTDGNITAMLGTTNFAAGSAIGFDTTTANRSYSAVLANTAQGSLGLVKLGANTLTLSGANTYTGGTIISNTGDTTGITVADASALGTGSVLVNGGQQYNPGLLVNNALTVANSLTLKRGNGGSNRAVLKLGATAGANWGGNITLDNTATAGFAAVLTGGTTAATASVISGNIGFSTLGTGNTANPTLALRSSNSFGKITGSVSLSTGYVQLLDSSKWEFSNVSNTWGTLDISNSGAIVTVGADNTLSPTGVVTSTSSTGGTLQLNDQAGTTAHSQTIAGLSGKVKVGLATGSATLTLDTTADQSCSGVISGAISLVKTGSAIQILTGVNTYTGSTTVSGGTLVLGNTGAISTGDLTINNGTLDLRKGTATRNQAVNNLTLANATVDIGLNANPDSISAVAATVSGTNTLRLHGSIPTGTYNLISSQAPLGGTFVLDTNNVAVSGFPTSYFGSVVGENYVLTVSGAATPYTAYWKGDVSSVWNESSAAPDSNWAADSTGTTDAGQIPGAITDVFFSSANAANTDTTLGADTSINTLTFENGTATVGGSNTLSILATSGIGLDVLSGANATLNTYSTVGTATVAVEAGGVLTVNGGGLGSGPLLVDGTVNLNANASNSSLAGAATGTITRTIPGTSALTLSGTQNDTFAGAINDGAGILALAKGGTSTLTLTGISAYSGGTTVSGGIIQVNSSTALGTGAVGITSAANKIYLGGGVTLANPITISSTGSTDYQGSVTANGGAPATITATVTVGSNPSTGGHFASSGTNSVLRLMGPVNVTGGAIPNSRVGTVEVGGGGNYTEFRIGEGTLRLAANNGLNPAAVLNMAVSNPATFDLAGFSQTLAGVSQNNAKAATIGNSSTTADSVLTTTATATYSGVIKDAIGAGTRTTGIAVNGGTLTLSGINTYTGNTTVNNGTSLVLVDNAQLRFSIGATSGATNGLSGAGSATLDGDFNIDTSLADAAPLTSGTWVLENLAAVYGGTFRVISGATAWTASGDVWTKTTGGKNYSFDEATGVLTMTSSGFESWAAAKGLTGADAAFDADPDKDGLDNGLEFVLGGEPNPANPGSNSASLLPTMEQSGGNMIFTFKRKDLSESGVALNFQWSEDLSFPSPANDVPVGAVDSTTDTITVDVTEDAPDADTDTVVITVPAAKAAAGKIFGRLRAVKLP
ncbi:MAG: autotransporter-associated beta strand repeat-containing protein [Verrucomicrobia bacterium]|nr:autotransporter-associated beta strand repeat-containing protein [Verrucomicrobiota bacterium]